MGLALKIIYSTNPDKSITTLSHFLEGDCPAHQGKYDKLISVEKLNAKLNGLGEPFAEMKGEEVLSIDAGALLSLEAARAIAKHYGLPGEEL